MINIGYMVMEPGVFDYIDGDDQPLEREPFERLAADGQMMGYIHEASGPVWIHFVIRIVWRHCGRAARRRGKHGRTK